MQGRLDNHTSVTTEIYISNGTTEIYISVPAVDLTTILQMCAEALVALLTIAGNLLVLVAIATVSSLQTVTNYFVASLAFADLLVGVIGIPCVMVADMGIPANFFGCLTVNSMIIVLTQISIFCLMVIAVERFYAIRCPYDYLRLFNTRVTVVIIVVSWSAAIVVGLIPIFGWNKDKLTSLTTCTFLEVIDLSYMVYFVFFVCVLVPLVIMFAIYSYIYSVVRRQMRQIAALTVPNVAAAASSSRAAAATTTTDRDRRNDVTRPPAESQGDNGNDAVPVANGHSSTPRREDNNKNLNALYYQQSGRVGGSPQGATKLSWKQETRAAKWFAVVLTVFAICWLPLHIINTVMLLGGRTDRTAMRISVLLSHLNSAVNPILYAYSSRKFSLAFRSVLRLKPPADYPGRVSN